MELTKYKLGDIATIYDGPHATPKRTDNGPVYLGIDAITEDCKINPNEFTFLSEDDYKIWTKRVVPQFKDIVFSYEATLGRYAIIPGNFYGCLGRRLGIIRVKSDAVDYKWLYYFFQSPQWKCYIKNHIIKGSTVNRISVDEMPGYEIPACGIADQKKIATVLSALDDKIALNKKMNQKLEAMAKRLYDYWFVQYDFPDKNGHPYKTTGGPMTYNPTLKREIPVGWEVKTLKECIKHINTGLNPRDNFVLGNGDIKYVTVKNLTMEGNIDFSGCDFIDEDALKKVHKRSDIAKGDVLYASICPLGRSYLINKDPVGWDINESVFSIRPNLDVISSEFLSVFLKDSAVVEKASKMATGSIFKGIRIKELENMILAVPVKDVMEKFSKQIKNLIELEHKNTEQIAHLTALRDKLLPLLMNGQVVVD